MEMRNWKIAGFLATLMIVLSIPIYYFKVEEAGAPQSGKGEQRPAAFAGSLKCKECHQKEYDKWLNSNHDHAMDVANEKTVLGDFNNAVFQTHGVASRFYKKDGRFFVHTQGPEGKMGDFEITHTFGWFPLQQYLVPFSGGRLQCLPIAWDVKEKKWYHLYPKEPLDPKDWLYWTNAAQNWNGMCAECHSTNLKKNYDIKTDAYKTTWSDIDVGCEACHGPGSRHVQWAEMPDMARPRVENFDLVVKTSGLGSRKLVELCAPCHSRRASLGDYTHAEADLLDSMLPTLLTEELYFPDGQILDEVYVYGSFTQSKMYHRDVRCSNCHDVHGLKVIKEGNALCLQCHRAGEYDSKEHHFHKKKGEKGDPIKSTDGKVLFEVGTGAECVQCHMPGRTYMGIHYRLDHSLRIPRPDLTVKIGTPNACNRCHVDKNTPWSVNAINKWYGPGSRPHYGTVIEAGRKRHPEAKKDLIRLAGDPLYPVIVRSTALSLLTAYPGEDTVEAFELALMDDEALIRRTAVQSIYLSGQRRQIELIAPLLYDQVAAVRMEAASTLAGEPSKRLSPDQSKVFQNALKEYMAAMEYSGDFAFGRYNLANLYAALNEPQEAIRNYEAALKIDDLFYPAKVNLAMLYGSRGENGKAERLFRDVVAKHPGLYDAAYSLGLLLAEMGKPEEALGYLERAAKGLPERSRIQYNLGLLLQVLHRDSEAEAALQKSLGLEPTKMDYLYALADFYIKRNRLSEAKKVAERMVAAHPDQRIGRELLEVIERHRKDVQR
jgi:tetratricopeptide (TPR) repeat protein